MVVDPTTSSASQLQGEKVLVVGSGPVGMRFVQELLQRSPDAHVHMFGNEPYRPYNRVQLSSLLAGEKAPAAIEIPMPDAKAHPNFKYSVASIRDIDSDARHITDSLGQHYDFDRLVIATGAKPHVPNVPGKEAKGVYTFRSMKDTEALYSRVASARHVVVVGGGLLGIEAARGLRRRNTRVTLIQQGSRLMNRQLDEAAANLLAEKVREQGIDVVVDSGVREVYVKERVTGVRTYTGEEVECDTVLFCAGIRPNHELAIKAGIKVSSGIVVDDHLQTSKPNIYAIGECSEHRGRTYGLVGPGLEQAAILADVMTGGHSVYEGSQTISRLKVLGEDVVSQGEVVELPDRPRQREWVFRSKAKGQYRKLVIHRGRLIGAVGVGEWSDFNRIQEAVHAHRRVWVWQLLTFWLFGRLWPSKGASQIQNWPASAMVCQCNQVSQGQLMEAVANGCASVSELGEKTRAGTVCGSCVPLLSQLVGASTASQKGWQWIFGISVVALALVAAFLLMPESQVADSVQSVSWFESFWNDKFWKQVTGFTLLGMVALGLLMSLRKRLNLKWMGSFAGWRFLHLAIGVISVGMIALHTGFHTGENLNRWLLMTFIAVLLLGSLAGLVTSMSHRLNPSTAQTVQKSWNLLHIVAAWPLPVLLMVHVLTVYYF